MNYMPEVAKMLGVKLGEPFMVGDCKYYFTEKGLCWNNVTDSDENCVWTLYYLLNGAFTIKRKPWKPKDDEEYWLVNQCGDIISLNWIDNFLCITNYKIGNCYRTKEEAEANRDKWVAFYASDKVLEV